MSEFILEGMKKGEGRREQGEMAESEERREK